MAATGRNWEKEGVVPDVETAPSLALQTALLLATEQLAANASADRKALGEKEAEKLRAELRKAEAALATAKAAS